VKSESRNSGLTLTEVMIITAFLLVVGVVLFPLFVPPKFTDGHRSTNLTKIKQIATASMIYCSDWDEWVPPYSTVTASSSGSERRLEGAQAKWRAALEPYIKNDPMFFTNEWQFPQEAPTRYAKLTPITLARGLVDGASSYGFGSEITPEFFGSPSGHLRLNLASPPQEFLELHGGSLESAPLYEDLAWVEREPNGRMRLARSSPRKDGKLQRLVSFFDGHAVLQPVSDLIP
jgi:hypothetical protein